MAILLKCGALFLHIPKTGGNWVSEILEEEDLVFANVGGRHSSDQLYEFEAFFRQPYAYGKRNRPFYKFCFVRHPLRWYESWFRMQQDLGWPIWVDSGGQGGLPYWNPTAELDGLGSKDFSTFVRNVLDYRPGFVSSMYHRYTSRGVHFVGRQEHLVDDLIAVLRDLNLPFDEGRVRAHAPANVGKPLPVSWAPGLEEDAERLEQAAIDLYGYAPGAPAAARLGDGLPLRPPFSPWGRAGGHGYAVLLPQFTAYGDNVNDPCRSLLVLYEDGVPLPKPHSVHQNIVEVGRGMYSHWKSALIFSSFDNSDPNANSRSYSVAFRHTLDPAKDHMRIPIP